MRRLLAGLVLALLLAGGLTAWRTDRDLLPFDTPKPCRPCQEAHDGQEP